MSPRRCVSHAPPPWTCRRASKARPASKTSLKFVRSWRRSAPSDALNEPLRLKGLGVKLPSPGDPRRTFEMAGPNTFRGGPDDRGLFGIHGGRFVAETLMPLVLDVERAYEAAKRDPNFAAELRYYLEHYVGRPSPLYFAERLTRHC